jgi:hypothetical protein
MLVVLFPQQEFTHFTYCRDSSRGLYETQCIQLDAQAQGEARFKRRDSEEVRVAIQLSPAARDRFLEVLENTDYLADGARYESNRKVADLGLKRLTLVAPSGNREASFNYSSLKEVTELANFFEGLINQESIRWDIENALQFDRLSIPRRIEQIAAELKAKRIADPPGLVPLLERIQADRRVINYARVNAGKLKDEILNPD